MIRHQGQGSAKLIRHGRLTGASALALLLLLHLSAQAALADDGDASTWQLLSNAHLEHLVWWGFVVVLLVGGGTLLWLRRNTLRPAAFVYVGACLCVYPLVMILPHHLMLLGLTPVVLAIVALTGMQIYLFLQINVASRALNIDQFTRCADLLERVMWGPYARWWTSAQEAVRCYLRNDRSAGDRIMDESVKLRPKNNLVYELLVRMIGARVADDPEAIVAVYQRLEGGQLWLRKAIDMKVTAARAYADSGRLDEALTLLETITAKISPLLLDVYLAPLYARFGMLDWLTEAHERGCRFFKVEEYVLRYQRGVCSAVLGETDRANQEFEAAREALPDSPATAKARLMGDIFARRIAKKVDDLSQFMAGALETDYVPYRQRLIKLVQTIVVKR